MSKHKYTPLSYTLKAELFSQLAVMEHAGLPTDISFSHLLLTGSAQSRLDATKKFLKRGKDIASAGTLSGLFDPLESAVLTAACNAGSPAQSYRRFGIMYSEKARLQKAMRSRLRLPMVVFLMSLVLNQLPAFVTGSMGISTYVWSVLRPLLLVTGVWCIYRLLRHHYLSASNQRFNDGIDALGLSLPLFGEMQIRENAYHFFESLGLMLEAGMPLFDALPLSCKTIRNSMIRRDFEKLLNKVVEGRTFAEALQHCKYLSQQQIIGMVKVGEESGTLAEMLWRHAQSESAAISLFREQLAAWIPRIIYSAVAMWVAYGVLTSGAFMPHVPKDLF
jgi:general secretion pathway protein F